MRKTIILTASMLLLVLGTTSLVQAAELPKPGLPTDLSAKALASAEGLPKAGLTPDSPFYFFDTLGEKIGMFFTFGAEKKAEKALKFAEEKLAEAKVMAEKGKTKALEKANKKYQEFLGVANEKVEKIKEKGKDVEKLVALITEKTLKHQEVLSEVFEKVPEAAKKGIENAIEMSKKGFEQAVKAVSGAKKQELEQRFEEVKTRVQEKIEEIKAKKLPEEAKKLPVSGEEEKERPKPEEPKEEEKPKPVGGDFSSPEAAFNTLLEAMETKDSDLFLECTSKRTLEEVERNPKMSLNTEDPAANTGNLDVNAFRQAGYKVSEKTNKYAIMVPQTRTIEIEGAKGDLPDLYFENEDGLWKFDFIAFIADILARALFPEALPEAIDNWKKSMELPSGYIEME